MHMFNIDHYAISISNTERSIKFYEKLDFTVVKDWEADDKSLRIVHMMNGNFILEMFCYTDGDELPKFSQNLNSDLKVNGSKHFGLWVDDLDIAGDYLMKVGILQKKPVISQGRLGRPYFFIKDPDGIFVEIISKR